MDDQDQALNPTVEETAETATPAENQTTEETQEIVTEETPKRKGAESRIRELSSTVHSLRDKIAELTTPVGSRGTYVPQQPQESKPLVGPGEEIDAVELERRMAEREQRILQQANQMVDFKTQQAATIARINRETVEVVAKHKELDPDSDQFDQELSDAVYEAVEAKVKSDPTASVKEFVEKQMKLYKRAASREEAGIKAEISKQSAQSAIKPSQNRTAEKPFAELSVEEMRSKLGYAS